VQALLCRFPEEMIKNATLYEESMYFTIGTKLIDELMIGEFPQTNIIIAGCESSRTRELPTSLILRGAGSVIGWDRTINSMENDKVMLALLKEVLINKIGNYDAVHSVMEEFGPDLQYSSKLYLNQPGR